MKASAQLLFNPNLGIPIYPFCILAAPTDIFLPGYPTWPLQTINNGFGMALIGFNNGGGKYIIEITNRII